jgi:hypothetical protein
MSSSCRDSYSHAPLRLTRANLYVLDATFCTQWHAFHSCSQVIGPSPIWQAPGTCRDLHVPKTVHNSVVHQPEVGRGAFKAPCDIRPNDEHRDLPLWDCAWNESRRGSQDLRCPGQMGSAFHSTRFPGPLLQEFVAVPGILVSIYAFCRQGK